MYQRVGRYARALNRETQSLVKFAETLRWYSLFIETCKDSFFCISVHSENLLPCVFSHFRVSMYILCTLNSLCFVAFCFHVVYYQSIFLRDKDLDLNKLVLELEVQEWKEV